MGYENLKQRTKTFALNGVKLVERLPRDRVGDILGRQLLRAGTSVAANYRAACRAKSPADFISKLGTVEEEADESIFWMELLLGSGKLRPQEVDPLMREAGELIAITIASINTTRKSARAKASGRTSTPHSALRAPH
jgi:four helix bundle protein